MNDIPANQMEIRTDIPTPKNSFYTKYVKRFLDIVISSIAIVFFALPMLVSYSLMGVQTSRIASSSATSF